MAGWIRTRVLPWVTWAGMVAGVGWLWHDVRGEGAALGFALAVEYRVAPPRLGRVDALEVGPGQQVRAGQVVATLDAAAIDAEEAVLVAERARLEAELAAVRASARVQEGAALRGFDESVEAADLALRTARASRDVRAAELGALTSQGKTLAALVKERMADRRELDALDVRRAALKKEVETTDTLVHELVRQAAAARARRAAVPADTTELALGPIRAELLALSGREQLLAVRRGESVLRAPIDGEVAAVHVRPGEVAAAGAPVVTILGREDDDEVVVCLREDQSARVRLGEAVLVHPRGLPAPGVPGHVTRLGPQIAELPPRCRRNPAFPEWGREVAVALDEPAPLLPGQAFTVAFLGRPSPCADGPPDALRAAPPADTTPGAPVPIEVPPELAARTRFEPSALAWLPGRGRFVVASDDTGLPAQDEHAPWLFTMDERGRVDPEPLVVRGLTKVSDLEAIAPGPGDSLYILASQSRSRQGKRPPARQVFARVTLDGTGASVAAQVSLADLLDDAGAGPLAALGLDDTGALDIEGMTPTGAGGLLLGLKAPLDAQGRALLWHLPRPDVLLAGGGLVDAGLARWGTVSLRVVADGEPRAGGVSELLELADGSLLIATTASGAEPTRQDGALWHAPGRAALAAARPIRSFPGLKPEGLAARADASAIVIVFDAGAAPARRMELSWPAR